MLKFFFWILLLANAGLLAYQQGALDTLLPNGREPARIANQLNADKIRLISSAEAKPEPAPAAEPPTAQVEKKAEVLACIEIGNFNPEDAKRFSTQLAALALGERVSQRSIQEVSSHMVFIPPQGDRETAERKAEQLRQLGVTDFFIIQDNPALRWGISLGVFKQEEAARAHLAQLNRQGVRSARIVQRGANTGMVAFQLRKIDAQAKGALDNIKAGFPKQSMRECEPA
ncbi:MAG TPA: SPOR domain-containing protein [Noviherbaspirillum sp.]|nr:SPOR domain-containing protein [Noviherbaspirillum sp.]